MSPKTIAAIWLLIFIVGGIVTFPSKKEDESIGFILFILLAIVAGGYLILVRKRSWPPHG